MFRALAADPVLAARMDLAVLAELAKIEGKTIQAAEAELATLAVMPRQPAQTAPRISYLLAKIEGSQRRVEDFEKEMSALKKILSKEE